MPTTSDTDKDSGIGTRPLSELLVDLHVYRIPNDYWLPERRLAKNQAIDVSISAGFVRVLPELTLQDVRKEIAYQLGYDTLPTEYIFLRSIGRNFAKVRAKQEKQLKAKIFLPPFALEPELHLLEDPDNFLPYSSQSELEVNATVDKLSGRRRTRRFHHYHQTLQRRASSARSFERISGRDSPINSRFPPLRSTTSVTANGISSANIVQEVESTAGNKNTKFPKVEKSPTVRSRDDNDHGEAGDTDVTNSSRDSGLTESSQEQQRITLPRLPSFDETEQTRSDKTSRSRLPRYRPTNEMVFQEKCHYGKDNKSETSIIENRSEVEKMDKLEKWEEMEMGDLRIKYEEEQIHKELKNRNTKQENKEKFDRIAIVREKNAIDEVKDHKVIHIKTAVNSETQLKMVQEESNCNDFSSVNIPEKVTNEVEGKVSLRKYDVADNKDEQRGTLLSSDTNISTGINVADTNLNSETVFNERNKVESSSLKRVPRSRNKSEIPSKKSSSIPRTIARPKGRKDKVQHVTGQSQNMSSSTKDSGYFVGRNEKITNGQQKLKRNQNGQIETANKLITLDGQLNSEGVGSGQGADKEVAEVTVSDSNGEHDSTSAIQKIPPRKNGQTEQRKYRRVSRNLPNNSKTSVEAARYDYQSNPHQNVEIQMADNNERNSDQQPSHQIPINFNQQEKTTMQEYEDHQQEGNAWYYDLKSNQVISIQNQERNSPTINLPTKEENQNGRETTVLNFNLETNQDIDSEVSSNNDSGINRENFIQEKNTGVNTEEKSSKNISNTNTLKNTNSSLRNMTNLNTDIQVQGQEFEKLKLDEKKSKSPNELNPCASQGEKLGSHDGESVKQKCDEEGTKDKKRSDEPSLPNSDNTKSSKIIIPAELVPNDHYNSQLDSNKIENMANLKEVEKQSTKMVDNSEDKLLNLPTVDVSTPPPQQPQDQTVPFANNENAFPNLETLEIHENSCFSANQPEILIYDNKNSEILNGKGAVTDTLQENKTSTRRPLKKQDSIKGETDMANISLPGNKSKRKKQESEKTISKKDMDKNNHRSLSNDRPRHRQFQQTNTAKSPIHIPKSQGEFQKFSNANQSKPRIDKLDKSQLEEESNDKENSEESQPVSRRSRRNAISTTRITRPSLSRDRLNDSRNPQININPNSKDEQRRSRDSLRSVRNSSNTNVSQLHSRNSSKELSEKSLKKSDRLQVSPRKQNIINAQKDEKLANSLNATNNLNTTTIAQSTDTDSNAPQAFKTNFGGNSSGLQPEVGLPSRSRSFDDRLFSRNGMEYNDIKKSKSEIIGQSNRNNSTHNSNENNFNENRSLKHMAFEDRYKNSQRHTFKEETASHINANQNIKPKLKLQTSKNDTGKKSKIFSRRSAQQPIPSTLLHDTTYSSTRINRISLKTPATGQNIHFQRKSYSTGQRPFKFGYQYNQNLYDDDVKKDSSQKRIKRSLMVSIDDLPSWLLSPKKFQDGLREDNQFNRRQLLAIHRVLRTRRRKAKRIYQYYIRYLVYLKERQEGNGQCGKVADMWKKKFMEEVQETQLLKDNCRRMTQHLQLIRHQPLKQSLPVSLLDPSNQANYKIAANKLVEEIEELSREVEIAKVNLVAESKLKDQVEEEVKMLRAEVVDRKIDASVTRTQFQQHQQAQKPFPWSSRTTNAPAMDIAIAEALL